MAYINNKYRNLNEAVKNPDGIAILSILFYVNVSNMQFFSFINYSK